MDKSFIGHINVIKKAINSRKLVVFAGAGVSRDAGIPIWGELVDQLSMGLDLPEGERDALKVAQMYYNERDEKEYIEKVRQILLHKQTRYQPTHEAILKAKPEHILTTNFDDLFEQVIQEKAYPFSIVSDDKDFPYALNTNLLVKVHGNLDDTSIVLKEDDFLEYPYKHPLMESFIKSVFASKVVLFVGYGFSDPNLKAIIQQVRNILGKNFQYAFILSTAKKSHKSHREYLRKKGVHLIDYSESEQDILDFLRGNNYLSTEYLTDYKISEQGQSLCNFFDFIANYDVFYEPLRPKSIIDKLYESLYRYESINTLDKDFLVSLYPICLGHVYVKNHTISTDNEEFLNLFFNYIVIEDSKVKIIDTDSLCIPKDQTRSYEIKLEYIINKLNLSGIFFLEWQNDDLDKVKYKKIATIKDDCQCAGCRYLRFELDSVVSEVQENDVNSLSKVNDDLLLGFMNYKLGNYVKSVEIFSETAGKAWKSGRYIAYFLAMKNIKTHHNLVRTTLSMAANARKKLSNKIAQVDTHALLVQMKSALNDEEYKFLRDIDGFEQLEEYQKGIAKYYKEVVDTFNLYENGGRKWGTSEINELTEKLVEVFIFYWNNYIVIDAYNNFTNICEEAFEALIISFATDHAYENRLKKFDYLTLKLMVLYGSPSKILKKLNEYEVPNLEIDDESLLKFSNDFNRYLKSFFYSSHNNLNYNKQMRLQLEFDIFSDTCRRYTSMFCILLSGVKLSKELHSDIPSNLVSFLKVENFLRLNEYDYIIKFINSNAAIFGQKQFLDLFGIIAESKIRVGKLSEFFFALESIKKANEDEIVIKDKNSLDRILTRLAQSSEDKSALAMLYSIVSDELKPIVKEKILQRLENRFSKELYWEAYSRGIINNEHLDSFVRSAVLRDNLVRNEDGMLQWNGDNTLISLIIFIYKYNIILNNQQLQHFRDAPEYVKFILDPVHFNYDEFDLRWINLFKYKTILEKLGEVAEFKAYIINNLKNIRDNKSRDLVIKYVL